jgi:hypothetical protein
MIKITPKTRSDAKYKYATILNAIQIDWRIAEFLKDEIINDCNFMIEAVGESRDLLRFSPRLCDDGDFMESIIDLYEPQLVHFASDRLKDNFEFMRDLAKGGGRIAEAASDRLKDNFEFMCIALKHGCNHFIKLASKRLQTNYEFILTVSKDDYYILTYVDDVFKNDIDFMRAVIEENPRNVEHVIEYAGNSIRNKLKEEFEKELQND